MQQTNWSTKQGSAPLILSGEDVQKLLSPETGADARAQIASKVAGNYQLNAFDAREVLIAEQIFRLMVRDTELKVRAMLAETLKNSLNLPRDIVLVMAKDVEEVALPILKFSEVLTEEDLLSIVRATQDAPRLIAVSERRHVPEKLVDLLIDSGKAKVITALIQNDGAVISEIRLNGIVDANRDKKPLITAMAKRKTLPPAIAEKIISSVSDSIAETLRSKYKLGGEVNRVADKARESSTLQLITGAESEQETQLLVEQLHMSKRLTPSIVIHALCQGRLRFFEMSLAALAGIPPLNAHTLISDRGELGLRALYNQSGLPPDMFKPVRMVLNIVNDMLEDPACPRGASFANRLLERLLQQADAEPEPVENLSYIIALVRQGMQ